MQLHDAPFERRFNTSEFEVRTGGTGFRLAGHAAVFNKLSSDLGGFVERVAVGAFKDTLNRNPDVRALRDHQPSLILGRTTAGTLQLAEDRTGLAFEMSIPDTSYGRDLMVSAERGDITQCSFGFRTIADSWDRTERGYPLRTLEACSLQDGDVSAVTYPAYPDTDITARASVLARAIDEGRIPGDLEGVRAALEQLRATYQVIVNMGAIPETGADEGDHPMADTADMHDGSKTADMGMDTQAKPGMPVVPMSMKSLRLALMAKRFPPF